MDSPEKEGTEDVEKIASGVDKDGNKVDSEVTESGSEVTSDVPKNGNEANPDVAEMDKKLLQRRMPLLWFRIAYFLWSGAGGIPMVFLPLYLSHHGISVLQFSTILSFGSVFSFIGPVFSGVLADKFGYTKPVVIFNLVCHGGVLLLMLLLVQVNNPTESVMTDTKSNSYFDCLNSTLEAGNPRVDCNFTCLQNSSTVNEESVDVYEGNITDVYVINTTRCLQLHMNGSRISTCTEGILSCINKANLRNTNVVLVIYALLMVLHGTTTITIYRCFDVTILFMVKEYNTGIGLEYTYHTISEVIFRFAAGYIVHANTENEILNYDLTLWFTILLDCLILLSTWKLTVHIDKQKLSIWRDSLKLLKNVELLVVFVVAFVLGISFGFRSNFSLWYLEYLHAPGIMFALHPAIVSLYQVPMFLASDWIMTKMQPAQVFVASFLLYTANQLGYAFAENPWMTLLFEVTTVVNASLMFVALLQSCSVLAPKGLLSTVTSAAGALHTGVGTGVGTVIGGTLANDFGPRATFMIFATVNAIAAFMYILFLIVRKSSLSRSLEIRSSV